MRLTPSMVPAGCLLALGCALSERMDAPLDLHPAFEELVAEVTDEPEPTTAYEPARFAVGLNTALPRGHAALPALRRVELATDEPFPDPPAGPVRYALDPEASQLVVLVRYDRGSRAARMGNDHAVVAREFSARLRWDAEDPEACRVDLRVPVAALQVDPPGVRARLGLDGETSATARAQITANMLGPRQLDADRHPTIHFRSTSCDGAQGAVMVRGELSIRGQSRPVRVPMDVQLAGDRFLARGQFQVRHSDFGFEPYVAMGGALRNDDQLTFFLDIEGQAR